MGEVLCEVIRRCESAPVAIDLPQCQEGPPAADSDEEGYCKFIAELSEVISHDDSCAQQHEQQRAWEPPPVRKRLSTWSFLELLLEWRTVSLLQGIVARVCFIMKPFQATSPFNKILYYTSLLFF